jgi:hypothetical protein
MYPVWEVPVITSGFVIAIIAVIHILPSHFSVSAMWFNIYLETKAYRQNRPELLEFPRKFSKFILIFAYIFGALTGVGIWFAITVVNPRGTSALIHSYVWGWATEWVFFLIEILAIFIYFYTFDKIERKTHLLIGWIFALTSWCTLLVITGILAFQLTPGEWPQTGGFFDGFFNHTYWPQAIARTALMFSIGGAFAVAVASRLKNANARRLVTRIAGLWGLIGLIIGGLCIYLYRHFLPDSVLEIGRALVPGTMINVLYFAFVFLLLYYLYVLFRPMKVALLPTILAIFVIYAGIWSAERTREILRKPYVVQLYMYSNQIIGHDNPAKAVQAEVDEFNRKGILEVASLVPDRLRLPGSADKLETGRMIALLECSACHTLDPNGIRPLPKMVKRMSLDEPEICCEFLEIMGDAYEYMPPFVGTEEEAEALGIFLASLYQEGGE